MDFFNWTDGPQGVNVTCLWGPTEFLGRTPSRTLQFYIISHYIKLMTSPFSHVGKLNSHSQFIPSFHSLSLLLTF
jgi:hypothetical protein